jgi:hypothetical protein
MADEVIDGAFVLSLKRNNKQIKEDRAVAIAEVTQLGYRRKVEDLGIALKRMRRDQENALDLSPSNALSLMIADEFDDRKFIEKDHQMAIDIRNTEIAYDLARARYKYLFGEDL